MELKGKVLEKEPLITPLKNQKPIPKMNNFLLDVSDINLKSKKKLKERGTNPLDPTYHLPGSL